MFSHDLKERNSKNPIHFLHRATFEWPWIKKQAFCLHNLVVTPSNAERHWIVGHRMQCAPLHTAHFDKDNWVTHRKSAHRVLYVLHTAEIEAILTTAKEKCLNRRISGCIRWGRHMMLEMLDLVATIVAVFVVSLRRHQRKNWCHWKI